MTPTKYLTREEIVGKRDFKFVEMSVPEWGGKIRLQEMSGVERDEFEFFVSTHGKPGQMDLRGMRVLLLSLCIVDEDGKRLFSSSDLEVLGKKSARVLHRLFEKAQQINGIGEEEEKALLGNSGSDQSEPAGSGSQGK